MEGIEQTLTNRQAEFLAFSSRGFRQAEIAALCHVSESTVRNTLDEARRRLGARTIAQCVVVAIAYELLILDHSGVVYAPNRDLALVA